MTLLQTKYNQRMRITDITCAGAKRKRLAGIGFVNGSVITLAGKAPLGDPLLVMIEGNKVAIRRSDARFIHVEKDEKVQKGAK